jgi:catechol 2,3-dioxygenase-like lactoylglutathione lyase family enzyme
MLGDRRCATMLPASDFERAKQWYADTLGMKPVFEDPSGAQFSCGGGTEFWLYPSQFAGTNQATAMGFLAEDISSDVEELRSAGVTFEEYDLPGLKTVNGVAEFPNGERGAWFKDSEGNILALFESPRYK